MRLTDLCRDSVGAKAFHILKLYIYIYCDSSYIVIFIPVPAVYMGIVFNLTNKFKQVATTKYSRVEIHSRSTLNFPVVDFHCEIEMTLSDSVPFIKSCMD